jgi:hypothetical protein
MHATKPVTVRPTKATPNVSEVVTIESALCGDLAKTVCNRVDSTARQTEPETPAHPPVR